VGTEDGALVPKQVGDNVFNIHMYLTLCIWSVQ